MPVDVVDLEGASPILAMRVLRFGKLLVEAPLGMPKPPGNPVTLCMAIP
jgi:hypothetical protein